ncbi:peptidase M23, partial [Micromonospora sp. KC606]
MRDDDTLDDHCGPDGATGRSDDIPSSERVGMVRGTAATRALRTRLGALVNPRRPAGVALAAGLASCLGLAGVAGFQTRLTEPAAPAGVEAALAERAQQEGAASRDQERAPIAASPTPVPA